MTNKPWRVLGHALNRHGYAFQARVTREIAECTPWHVEAPEFPVEVNDEAGQVDIVAQRGNEDVYLVVECKAAVGSIADWCLAGSPQLEPHGRGGNFFVEYAVSAGPTGGMPEYYCAPGKVTRSFGGAPLPQYDVVLPVRVRARRPGGRQSTLDGPGRDDAQDRKVVEKAISQACRGVSGLLNYWSRNDYMHEAKRRIALVPTIVTTAALWACTRDLADAALQTGRIELAEEDVSEVGFALHRCRIGPRLRPSIEARSGASHFPGSFGTALHAEYLRTVMLVNAGYLRQYLAEVSTWQISAT